MQLWVVLPESLEGTLLNSGQVLGVGLVAHGGADAGVDGEGDGARGSDPVGHAPGVLTLLALGAVGVEGADHVLGAETFGVPGKQRKHLLLVFYAWAFCYKIHNLYLVELILPLIANGLWATIVEEVIGAQIVDH